MMNREAVRLAIRLGKALNCTIADFAKWDRKSYYYPDLPKNYQISQYDKPLCQEGWLDVPGEDGVGRVGIQRAHLEEDAGKNIHDTPGCTLVDLNRTGTPLLEIVTRPDLTSADQAYAFCTELQKLATYLSVSEGSMQKGQMRFEPNVNLAIVRDGIEYRTPISEIKNLNSFKAVRAAIEYETRRQLQDWMADNSYLFGERPHENRGWNDGRQVTELQRSKEQAHDYRYFPDPDLVSVEVGRNAALQGELNRPIDELPVARCLRFQAEYGLSANDAETILAERATADLFERAVEAGAPPKVAAKQFVNVWSKLANEYRRSIAELGIEAKRIGALAKMVEQNTVSASAAKTVAAAMLDSTDGPDFLAEQLGLIQVVDEEELAKWVDAAIAANEKAVQTILTNPKKAKASEGFLRGQVMKISSGKADPGRAGELIAKRVAGLKDQED